MPLKGQFKDDDDADDALVDRINQIVGLISGITATFTCPFGEPLMPVTKATTDRVNAHFRKVQGNRSKKVQLKFADVRYMFRAALEACIEELDTKIEGDEFV